VFGAGFVRGVLSRAAAARRGLASAIALAPIASPAYAGDPFEIQVYDADTNEVGAFGLELHSNYVVSGQGESVSPELPIHHVLHETLEPSVGVLPFLEIGAYLQTALQPDGAFDFAGTKLRAKVRLPDAGAVRFAVNTELSWLPRKYAAPRWGSEVRPIIEWHPGVFGLRLNPIIGFDWAGSDAGIPRLEPALAATIDIAGAVALGLEYYADFGPITRISAWSEQEHFVFETIDVIALGDYEIHAGIGEGLTSASKGIVLKAIFGHTF
jgi:hypothetical protein